MSNADTPNQGTGPFDAVAAFDNFLAASEREQEAPEEREAPQAEADNAEALEAEDDTDETPSEDELEASEADEGEGDDEASETDDEAEEAEDGADPLYTVKINGKEEQITLDEALKGYQRQSDYTRKSMALADARKEFEAEAEAVAQERAQYAELLSALSAQVEQQLQQEPDWERLYQENPLEYVRQKEAYRDLQEKRAAAQSEQERLYRMQAEQQQQQLAELLKSEKEKLVAAVPEWADKKRFDADKQKLREFGQSIGFSEEELAQTYDHRAVLALWKAMQYDQLVNNRPQQKTKKGPKPARGGAAGQGPRAADNLTRAKKRLAKTGSVRDAASVFEQLI